MDLFSFLLRIRIALLVLLLSVSAFAAPNDQQNLSVRPEVVATSDGKYWVIIRIRSPLALQRTGVRVTSDGWKSQKDFLMRRSGDGEFTATLGPYAPGAELAFAVFGEDRVAERWIWDNYFYRNHQIRIPTAGQAPEGIEKSGAELRPSRAKRDYIAAIEGAKDGSEGELRLSRKALKYLSRHKLYLSLTTSPKRIGSVTQMLETIDLTEVEKVYLNIPERFGRDGSAYVVPESLLNHPKVVINRIPVDLGPITKILPAAEIIQKTDPGAWIISVDDDIRYNRYLVRDLANAKAEHPDAVVSGSGQSADFWGMPAEEFPGHATNYSQATRSTAVTPVDVVEGFAGIIYRAGDLDVPRLKRLSALSRAAFASDDVVLSYALGESGIPKLRLSSRRYGVEAIQPFDYGLGADALHLGAGVTDAPTQADMNAAKYVKAFNDLRVYAQTQAPECPAGIARTLRALPHF